MEENPFEVKVRSLFTRNGDNVILDHHSLSFLKGIGHQYTAIRLAGGEKLRGVIFSVEKKCDDCREVEVQDMNHKELYCHLTNKHKIPLAFGCADWVCKKCLIKHEADMDKCYTQGHVKSSITPYLNTGFCINLSFDELNSLPIHLAIKLSRKLKAMKYTEFLKTRYWRMVSKHVKLQFGKSCQKCGSDKNPECHHVTYKNHGLEHLHWFSDLIVLCRSCHQKEHSK